MKQRLSLRLGSIGQRLIHANKFAHYALAWSAILLSLTFYYLGHRLLTFVLPVTASAEVYEELRREFPDKIIVFPGTVKNVVISPNITSVVGYLRGSVTGHLRQLSGGLINKHEKRFNDKWDDSITLHRSEKTIIRWKMPIRIPPSDFFENKDLQYIVQWNVRYPEYVPRRSFGERDGFVNSSASQQVTYDVHVLPSSQKPSASARLKTAFLYILRVVGYILISASVLYLITLPLPRPLVEEWPRDLELRADVVLAALWAILILVPSLAFPVIYIQMVEGADWRISENPRLMVGVAFRLFLIYTLFGLLCDLCRYLSRGRPTK